jgi:hypothetical protein
LRRANKKRRDEEEVGEDGGGMDLQVEIKLSGS